MSKHKNYLRELKTPTRYKLNDFYCLLKWLKFIFMKQTKQVFFGIFFQPQNSKSNSFSEHFNTKSHNLVVNFFILTIDTPTYLSNQTNLPRPPNKIFFLPNIPLKVTAPYLRCRQTKNSPTRTVHGHIFHTLYYYWCLRFKCFRVSARRSYS